MIQRLFRNVSRGKGMPLAGELFHELQEARPDLGWALEKLSVGLVDGPHQPGGRLAIDVPKALCGVQGAHSRALLIIPEGRGQHVGAECRLLESHVRSEPCCF